MSGLTYEDRLRHDMKDYSKRTRYKSYYSQYLFHVVYSHAGSDPEYQVSLRTVLAFFTGADSVPPLGYKSAVINFDHTNQYPTASTCAIQLTLPTKYQDYKQFKKELNVAFTMHGGFGCA